MKNKLSKVYAIIAFICLLASFGLLLGLLVESNASAEELPNEEVSDEITSEETPSVQAEPQEDDDFMTVFKNDILPLIVSAGGGILTLLIALFPYIKLKGKNKSLQGMYLVLNKSLEAYKSKADEFTVDNFLQSMQNSVITELKNYISDKINLAIESSATDKKQLNDVKVTLDTVCAQFENLLKAASIAWKEADGATEILVKSPTSEVLKSYYDKYVELKEAYENKQAKEVEELDKAINELEVYRENEQSEVTTL